MSKHSAHAYLKLKHTSGCTACVRTAYKPVLHPAAGEPSGLIHISTVLTVAVADESVILPHDYT